jgi:hypothetical protein
MRSLSQHRELIRQLLSVFKTEVRAQSMVSHDWSIGCNMKKREVDFWMPT